MRFSRQMLPQPNRLSRPAQTATTKLTTIDATANIQAASSLRMVSSQ
jgi:hypothetical protein